MLVSIKLQRDNVLKSSLTQNNLLYVLKRVLFRIAYVCMSKLGGVYTLFSPCPRFCIVG